MATLFQKLSLYRSRPVNGTAARVSDNSRIAQHAKARRLRKQARKTKDARKKADLEAAAQKLARPNSSISARAAARAKRQMERAKWERGR
jgi:hypothetical protein